MNQYTLVSNYRHNHELRESFNELAKKTFEIDFTHWYEKGYWEDDYIPYSFIDNGKVIANTSICKMSVIINNKTYNAVQIGTVMTDPHYQNKGLAKKLMMHVLELHKDSCDFMYLFANETVLDFYPKFGFTRLNESEYCLSVDQHYIDRAPSTRLEKWTIEENRMLLEDFASKRVINSSRLDVKNNKNLLMFYFTIVFPEAIYYIEESETIVLMEVEEETLHIYDIISRQKQDFNMILASIITDQIKCVMFYFTPDFLCSEMKVTEMVSDDDALFILSNHQKLKGHFKFPITSHC